jgi:hypothetical protein
MDESSQTTNRRLRRANVLMAATLELSGEAIPVKMRNLSSEGALVQGDRLPVEGAQLLFRKGDLCVSGRVAWSNGNQAGISFATPLAPAQVLRHIPAPRPRVAPKFNRPGLTTTQLTAQEREFAERCLFAKPLRPFGD